MKSIDEILKDDHVTKVIGKGENLRVKRQKKLSKTEMNCMITVLYDDNPLNYKVKYFNESEYQDLSDTYARMQDAVNKFCINHDVVKIETTQNNDEDLVTVVTYKE